MVESVFLFGAILLPRFKEIYPLVFKNIQWFMVTGEVKEVVNTIFKGAEEANADMFIVTYLDSPDFVFTYNGNSFSYKQCAKASVHDHLTPDRIDHQMSELIP